ncbi:hypothetical protein MHYP_G00022240 [Metynnis hypsauchen]
MDKITVQAQNKLFLWKQPDLEKQMQKPHVQFTLLTEGRVASTLPLCTGRDYILGLTFLAFSPQVPLARVVCGDAETLPLPPATRSPRHRRAARTLRLAPAERQAPPTEHRIGWSR